MPLDPFPNRCWDIAIYLFSKWRPSAILKFDILPGVIPGYNSEGQIVSSCQILCRSGKQWLRCGRFLFLKMAAVCCCLLIFTCWAWFHSNLVRCLRCSAPLSKVWHRLLQHVLKQALGSTAPVTEAGSRLSVLLQQVDHSRASDASPTSASWTRWYGGSYMDGCHGQLLRALLLWADVCIFITMITRYSQSLSTCRYSAENRGYCNVPVAVLIGKLGGKRKCQSVCFGEETRHLHAQLNGKPPQFSITWNFVRYYVVAKRVERWTYGQQVVGSNPARGKSCVTTLGKLFTPMCLCHQAV